MLPQLWMELFWLMKTVQRLVTDLDGFMPKSIWKIPPRPVLDIIAEVPLSQFGPSPFWIPGSYTVGIWLPPGSEYEIPEEKTFRRIGFEWNGSTLGGQPHEIEKATFLLSSVSSTLSENSRMVLIPLADWSEKFTQ